jgi:predicted anti-sigma-YlaC factor YlaD
MGEATRHIAECSNCREQVERFQQTLAMLRTAPEPEPPRDIVFEFEKPRRLWKWLPAAAMTAALLIVTIALAGRVHMQWHDSQVTIAFGQTAPAPQVDQTAALATELERLKGHVAFLEGRQEAVERNTVAIATTIEPLTRTLRAPTGD